MTSDRVFSFCVGERAFGLHEHSALVEYVKELNGSAPPVALRAGSHFTVSVSAVEAITFFAGLSPSEDPVVSFTQFACA